MSKLVKGSERIKEFEMEYKEHISALEQLDDKMLGFAVSQGNGYIMTEKRWRKIRQNIWNVKHSFDDALNAMMHDKCCRQVIIEKEDK